MTFRCPVCESLLEADGEMPFDPYAETVTCAENTQSPHLAKRDLPQFDSYELLEQIGSGGMGVVYKARHLPLNRIVALKMIRGAGLVTEEHVKRFQTEAEAAAKIDHSGIVQVFEVGDCDGQHFIAMSHVEGESLAGHVKNGPLPEREAARLMKSVAEAVGFAHSRGVIHRDLKPSNILMDIDDNPRVSDFGLAKVSDDDSSLTATGQALGTPSYMSPEQAAGLSETVSPAADIYSIGATLYCLLTGRPPFQAATKLETLRQVCHDEPASPCQLNGSLSKDIETICLKCLEKEPQKRYVTASEVADDLGRFLEGKPVKARPISRPARLWRWCRRNPRIAGMTGGIFALMLAGLVTGVYAYAEHDANVRHTKFRENWLMSRRSDLTEFKRVALDEQRKLRYQEKAKGYVRAAKAYNECGDHQRALNALKQALAISHPEQVETIKAFMAMERRQIESKQLQPVQDSQAAIEAE